MTKKTKKEKKVITNEETPVETAVEKTPEQVWEDRGIKTPVSKVYTLEIDINDSHFKAEAGSLKDAFVDIIGRLDFPFAPKTRVFIKYGKGDVVNTKIMNVVMARRIFSIMDHKESVVEIFTNKLEEYLNE